MAAGLEQLDAYGALDDLPWSLDDPVWDLLFPAEIDDQCGTFTLEMLDNFGTLDSLPYSLDDVFWQQTICTKFGQGVAASNAFIDGSAVAIYAGNASVDTSATVDGSAIRTRTSSGDIAGNASVDATGTAIFVSSASITGSAEVDSTAIRIRTSLGAIDAYATVTAYATAIWSDSASIDASAGVDANGIRVRTSSGDISGSADVSSDSLRIRTSNADIQAQAQVTALGGVVYNGFADVLAVANLTCVANAIFSAYGSVSALATVDADGTKLGQNWSGTTGGTGTYTPGTGGTGTFTPTTPGTGEFTPVTPPFNEWGSIAPAIGEPFQGGFYAGEYVLGGTTYFLIVGDKQYEQRASYVTGALYGVSNYQLYVTENDGLENTNWIAFPTLVQTRANTNSYFYKIRQKNIAGTTDWYYPSKNEMELIIRNLYPTSTTASRFKTGGTQALGTSNPDGYWTSSIRSIYNYPAGRSWYLWASETKYGGGMYSPPYGSNNQEFLFYFRPVRRVKK
jgi:hypothetical protein